MTPSEFKALREKAAALAATQPAKNKVSLDAVFVALAVQSTGPARKRRKSDDPVPDWFNETLAKLKGKGESVTIGRFLMLAGRFPATRSDSLAVAQWLREAGFTPRKTGGNLLFDL